MTLAQLDALMTVHAYVHSDKPRPSANPAADLAELAAL